MKEFNTPSPDDTPRRSDSESESLESQHSPLSPAPHPAVAGYCDGGPIGGRAPAPPGWERTLKYLLTISHPDRWAQGQPAVEVAHALTIAVNAIRAQLEGHR